jgi:hypothetical protein
MFDDVDDDVSEEMAVGSMEVGNRFGGEGPCCHHWSQCWWAWYSGDDGGGGDDGTGRKGRSLHRLQSPWMRSFHDQSAGPETKDKEMVVLIYVLLMSCLDGGLFVNSIRIVNYWCTTVGERATDDLNVTGRNV